MAVEKKSYIPSFPKKRMLFVSKSLFVNPFPQKKQGFVHQLEVVEVAGRTILPMIPRVVVTEGIGNSGTI